jgi:hypothetical protein
LKISHKAGYLSKNNQNVKRLEKINAYFPASKILVPFRDPLQQANSLFSQHQKFVLEQQKDQFVRDYMTWIGHSEFGLDYEPIVSQNLRYPDAGEFDHWLEQWYLTYKFVDVLPMQGKEFYLICYESLCRKSEVWELIQRLLEIQPSTEFDFIESQKDVLPPFDQKLRDKCYDLYEALRHRSLGG